MESSSEVQIRGVWLIVALVVMKGEGGILIWVNNSRPDPVSYGLPAAEVTDV